MEEQSVHSSTSDINSEEAAATEPLIIPRKKRICLVGSTGEDPALGAAAQQFSVPVLKSEQGTEYVEDTTYCTYYILSKFEGADYDTLHKTAHRILGPTALLQLAEKKESLPSINRPMYTQSMLGTIVVFTGFRKKEELTRLINMIHNMGGSIRKDMGNKVTHLIANCCGGDKYRYAITFRIPIMSSDWVLELWNARDDVASSSSNDKLIADYKLKPFFGAKVCFFGFPDDEKTHMYEVLQQQGGEPAEIDDPNCTHVVTNNDGGQTSTLDKSRASWYRSYSKQEFRSLTSERSCDIESSQNFSFVYYNPYTNEKIPNSCPSSISSIHSQRCCNCLCHFCFCNYNCEKNSTMVRRKRRADDSSSSPRDDSTMEKFCVTGFPKTSKHCQRHRAPKHPRYDSAISLNDSSIDGGGNYHSDDSGYSALNSLGSSMLNLTQLSLSQAFDNPTNLSFASIRSPSRIFSTVKNLSKQSRRFLTPRRYVLLKRHSSCVSESTQTARLYSNQNKKIFRIYSHPNLSRNSCSEESPRLLRKNNSFSSLRDIGNNSYTSWAFNVYPKRDKIQKNSCCCCCSRERYLVNYFRRMFGIKFYSGLFESKSSLRNGAAKCTSSVPSAFSYSNDLKNRANGAGEKTKRDHEKPDNSVVDESNVNSLPDLASVRAHIVKAEWFWTSVQNEGAAYEKDYLFEDYLESVMSPMAMARRDSQAATPRTASTKRKRKRMAETLCSLVQNGADSPAVHKRRSSISDAGHLSVSGSFLDCTSSPDKQLDAIPEVEAVSTEAGRKNLSPRHQVFLELVTTESNYVGILSTIMTLFKEPLEDLIEMSGELLNSTEAKIIFGNFPPIYEVHKKMLEELRYNASHWAEDVSIGNIFLKYAPDLVKAYPPYVNFFENTKEMLDQCDQNKPRFHAFLKICQTKPECGRQSLKELLIKPVQRLPSISLLLNDILKHTSKSNPDHSALELSISSIKEVMTYINEDKRKTEGQLVMFDIFNDIDNCPAHLVSSHRSFIGKCEVMELGEGLSGRGDHLVLFLFTDTLEICKKRSKAFNSLKSPKEANGLHPTKLSQGKPYKHIRMLSLSTIKKVVDIRETDECQKVFALMVRSNQELKEKLFSFTITDEEVNKTNYLRTLCRQMANSVCKADADTFLISLDSHQLEIDTSDVALGTLSKAFKSLFHNFYLEYMDPFASRTRMKVGRAFSFNKTPSKLKRAMSTMMSPFGSTNSLTPASQQLAQMRLASCNNINELGNGGSGSPTRDEVLVAPMSVQPTRKAKCSSLSMASLRRNCSEEVVQDKSEL
ncbi:protein ECT2 isoform X3 [Neodiprion virginianus]|uniref:protein ECT2 isoform X3 n=1 Tax=Neodiprion virginianus TaxID=2961670 RepID=UPI001EE6CAC2|nr:protein ECT2 isoform X3 [Neodiprion virginianus]